MLNQDALRTTLSQTDALIQRSGMRVPGWDAPLPFRLELNTLRRKQAIIKEQLVRFEREQANQPGNLGFPFLIVGAGVAAVTGISAIAGWIYSNFTDAKELDAQTQIYSEMRSEGVDAKDAARTVFGGNSDWGSIMNKIVLVAVLGSGIYLVSKFVK